MSIKVKALEWTKHNRMDSIWWDVSCRHLHNYAEYEVSFDGHYWRWSFDGVKSIDAFGSPDEAKAAAQADYERRILAALEPSTDMREAVEALERANALTSAGNRTFDELTRDVTRANGEIRMALNIAYALTGAKP